MARGPLALTIAGLIALPVPAAPKDLGELAVLLAPAFLAQQLAGLCATYDPAFIAETSGPRGSAHDFAQHVKDEITLVLSSDEVPLVLRGAAGVARATAEAQLRALAARSGDETAVRIGRWCRGTAKGYVRTVVGEHEAEHERFERAVDRALAD